MRRLLLFTALSLLLIFSLGATLAQDDEPQYGGSLIVASETMGDSLDIALWQGFGGLHVIDSIGEGLVRADFETGEALPGLAESWEISNDGLVYTFHLREGMVFHDGEPINAAAVVRSMNRPLNPDDPSYFDGMYMYFNQGIDNWESIEAIDEFTVQLTLKAPNAAQLLVLTRPDGYIMSPKAMDEFGTEVGLNVAMAGPFKVDRFVPGQEAVLVANEDYWAGRPFLDQIIIRSFPDEASVLAALEAGEVDLTLYAPFTSVPRFATDESDGIRIEIGAPLVSLFAGLNVTQAPLDNLLIRQAINYAIDRDALIEAGLNGLAVAPASILAPNDLGYDPAGEAMSVYDPDRAAELIAESGIATPIPIEVSFENNRFWPQLGELMAADLEAVGFEVTLARLDQGSFQGRVSDGVSQIALNQRSTFYPDPHDKAIMAHSVLVPTDYTHHQALEVAAPLDTLIDSGLMTVDRAEREAIYTDVQRLILDNQLFVYLANLTPPIFVNERVHNVDTQGTAAGRVDFRGVWVSN